MRCFRGSRVCGALVRLIRTTVKKNREILRSKNVTSPAPWHLILSSRHRADYGPRRPHSVVMFRTVASVFRLAASAETPPVGEETLG